MSLPTVFFRESMFGFSTQTWYFSYILSRMSRFFKVEIREKKGELCGHFPLHSLSYCFSSTLFVIRSILIGVHWKPSSLRIDLEMTVFNQAALGLSNGTFSIRTDEEIQSSEGRCYEGWGKLICAGKKHIYRCEIQMIMNQKKYQKKKYIKKFPSFKNMQWDKCGNLKILSMRKFPDREEIWEICIEGTLQHRGWGGN